MKILITTALTIFLFFSFFGAAGAPKSVFDAAAGSVFRVARNPKVSSHSFFDGGILKKNILDAEDEEQDGPAFKEKELANQSDKLAGIFLIAGRKSELVAVNSRAVKFFSDILRL